jgi:dihydrolipoamide dehydrogenase
MTNYDVIVIGSGPGGYVSAIRCAQLGLKTAIVEGRDTLGGTCLNVGCIPSKALLHASHSYHEATHNFDKMGLIINNPKIDFDKMQNYKNDVISQNTKGIEFLLKKNKISWLKGWAKIVNKNQVTVGENTYDTKNIVIASGSEPSTIPNVEIDENRIVNSTGALSLSKIPKSMIVIGAGVIGLEMGSIYSRLGTDVTVIEYMDHITPGMDLEISKNFQRISEKTRIEIHNGCNS